MLKRVEFDFGYQGTIDALNVLTFLILGVELVLIFWLRRGGTRRLAMMASSASPTIPFVIVELATAGVYMALFQWAWSLAFVRLPTTPWVWLTCLLMVDFVYYWEHRASHRIGALWAIGHSVHHSANHFDLSVALRVSFVDVLVSPFFYLPLVLLGFPPLLVFGAVGINLTYQSWIHTEAIGRLRLLDPWLNTPSSHRVHHARQPQYLDKNYGGILMIWDRLFGTYESEIEKPDYGLTTRLISLHPWDVHFAEVARFLRELGGLPRWSERLRRLIEPPGGRGA